MFQGCLKEFSSKLLFHESLESVTSDSMMLHDCFKVSSSTGCPQKKKTGFLLNILATKYQIFKSFFLLKIEIHEQILNKKPFLCNIHICIVS